MYRALLRRPLVGRCKPGDALTQPTTASVGQSQAADDPLADDGELGNPKRPVIQLADDGEPANPKRPVITLADDGSRPTRAAGDPVSPNSSFEPRSSIS